MIQRLSVECHQADASEQAARRAARKRPACAQRHLFGLAIRCTVARCAGELWTSYDLLRARRSPRCRALSLSRNSMARLKIRRGGLGPEASPRNSKDRRTGGALHAWADAKRRLGEFERAAIAFMVLASCRHCSCSRRRLSFRERSFSTTLSLVPLSSIFESRRLKRRLA